MMVAGVLPLVVVGVAINLASAQSLRAQSFEQLKSVQAAKSQRLADYFNTIQGQIAAFAEDRMVIEAMKDFQGAFSTVATENEITPADIERMRTELKTYYSGDFAQEYEKRHNGEKLDILPNWPSSTRIRLFCSTHLSTRTNSPWGRRTSWSDRRPKTTSRNTRRTTKLTTR